MKDAMGLRGTRPTKKLNRDPAASLEHRMNDILLSLNRVGSIPDPLYRQLRSFSGMTPLFYGLPEIHKPHCICQKGSNFLVILTSVHDYSGATLVYRYNHH